MKILIASSHFYPAKSWGGPIQSAWNLARGLADIGQEVTVVTTDAQQYGRVRVPRLRREQGVRILTYPITGGGQLAALNRQGVSSTVALGLARELRRADVVYINGLWGLVPLLASLGSQALHVPYVVCPRGAAQRGSLHRKGLKKSIAFLAGFGPMLKNASALHYVSELEKQQSESYWTKNIASIIMPNSIELATKVKQTSKNASAKTLHLGIFGRIHQIKGFDILLPALARSGRRDICLHIVGNDEGGYNAEVQRLAGMHDVKDLISFDGFLVNESLQSAFQRIDLLLLPSHQENFGNVVAEAAVLGTPSLVSENAGIASWVTERNIGQVVPVKVDSWAQVLRGLSRQQILEQWDPARLRREAISAFSISSIASQLLAEFRRVLAQKNVKGKANE